MTNEWRQLRHRSSGKEKQVILPAFNGYIFAVGVMSYWKTLRDHPKVIDVLCFPTSTGYRKPYEVDARLVESDYFREKQELVPIPLKVGSTIRVVDGPFTGLTGVYVGSGFVELVLFGRTVKTKIPQHMLIIIQGLSTGKKRAISNSVDKTVDQ